MSNSIDMNICAGSLFHIDFRQVFESAKYWETELNRRRSCHSAKKRYSHWAKGNFKLISQWILLIKKKIVHNRPPLICGRWIVENIQNSYWFYFVFQSIFQMSSLNTQHLWALNVLKWRKSGWVLLCFYSLFFKWQ